MANSGPASRVVSVDLLRGLVIVIMAIDHTREYVHWAAMNFQPEDLAKTTPMIFFTRWITHFCAPVFMFCAGLGAWFRLERDGSVARMSRYLITRGLWLILLELTAVRLAFFFDVKYDVVFLLVFWALGLCMMALAGLIRLPFKALVVVGLAMVLLHNLLDPIRAQSFGSLSWLWNILHQPGVVRAQSPLLIVAYPIVPWIGVMALGFAAGRLYRMPPAIRKSMLLRIGLAATVAFVAFRALNVYGDPRPWVGQGSASMTVLSFLNTTKYPPSLSFLLMTLGPALIVLGLLDGVAARDRNPLLVFGRTPLLFFVVHLAVIHALAIALTALRYGNAPFLFTPPPTVGTPRNIFPADYGWNLGVVFVVWLIGWLSCIRCARVSRASEASHALRSGPAQRRCPVGALLAGRHSRDLGRLSAVLVQRKRARPFWDRALVRTFVVVTSALRAGGRRTRRRHDRRRGHRDHHRRRRRTADRRQPADALR